MTRAKLLPVPPSARRSRPLSTGIFSFVAAAAFIWNVNAAPTGTPALVLPQAGRGTQDLPSPRTGYFTLSRRALPVSLKTRGQRCTDGRRATVGPPSGAFMLSR
jgi:hypothetical protein